MAVTETSLDNLVLLLVFAGLVVATCLTGACTLMAKRWQGVDAAPRMLPYLTVANSVVAVIGAYRWWGFALGSLVNMAVTVLLVLINRRMIGSQIEKKADDRTFPSRGSSLDSVVVEITIRSRSNDNMKEASVRDVQLGEANRSLAAKSVVDMLREHQQKFGSNACNASDPAPFTGAGARQSILVSAFSPASRLSFETHRRSKSLEKDSIPPVHSVTDDIVDSLMNGAVMEQLLNNRRNSKVVSGDCEATSAC